MAKCSKYHAKCKVTMPKCSKYHSKWQVLVPNCCKYKANGTRKESQTKIQNLRQKKTILHPIKTWFMNPGVDIRSVPFKKQISEWIWPWHRDISGILWGISPQCRKVKLSDPMPGNPAQSGKRLWSSLSCRCAMMIWIDLNWSEYLNYCSTKYRKIIWSNWAKKWDARDEIAPFAPFVQSSQSIFDSQSLQSDSFGWDYRTKWPFFVSLGFCFNHQTADWGSLFLGSLFLGVPGVSLGCPWGRPWRSRQGTLSTYLMQQLERECEAICAVASVASERLRPRLPQRPRRNGKFDTENLGTWEWNWESDDYNIL